MNAVTISDVTKKYGDKLVLRGIDIVFNSGSITTVIGPSASGKTALANIIAGTSTPDRGACTVFGHDTVTQSDEIHSSVGIVSAAVNMYEGITALDNAVFFGKINNLSGKESTERASELMHRLNLWKQKDLPLHKMSTSSKNKLSIVRALMNRPKLLILDEPFAGFDSDSINEAKNLIQYVNHEEETTVIFLTNSPMSFDGNQRFIIMIGGTVKADGTLDEIRKKSHIHDKAMLRTAGGSLMLPGENMKKNSDGYFEKDINSESEISELIKKAVFLGNDIIEAKIFHQTIDTVYHTYLERNEEELF